MTRQFTLAAVVCAIGIGACASASVAAEQSGASRRAAMPVEGEITDPDWQQLPDGDVLANYYPKLAHLLQLPGKVKMKCKVTATGVLEACAITEETPAGIGFGEATLAVAQYFRMKPKTVDGVPVGGGEVVIPMNWRMPDIDLPDDPNADGPPPAPEALALGRRLFAATGGTERTAGFYRMNISRAKELMGGATTTTEGQAALAALDKAIDGAVGGYGESMAVGYAKTFSIEELRALVAFFESPPGQAWRSRDETLQKTSQYAGAKAWRQILADAQREFCAKTACLPAPSPAPAAQTPSTGAGQPVKP